MANNSAGTASAPGRGAALFIEIADVQFNGGPLVEQNMANNSPDDIYVSTLNRQWTCSSDSLTCNDGPYFVTGSPCDCGDAAGTNTTCGCRRVEVWSVGDCACQVRFRLVFTH